MRALRSLGESMIAAGKTINLAHGRRPRRSYTNQRNPEQSGEPDSC
jgi:hypothetical protein